MSRWLFVLSGVPHGSILAPLLFLFFINDIDVGIVNNLLISSNNKLLKFADDTKLAAVVSDKDGVDRLQMDLVNLYKWSCDWQMLFNVDKCKVLHFAILVEKIRRACVELV